MTEKKAALRFKALGDEHRIRILQLLGSGEKCACRLLEEMNISQPTLSHHMKVLCDAQLVVARKEGKWMHYSVDRDGVEGARDCLGALLGRCGEGPCDKGL